MRKSPFSTPRGNGNGRPSFGWKSSNSPRGGYGRPNNVAYCSPNQNPNVSQSSGDDFIPFNANTPSPSDRKFSGNWSSPNNGNWLSPGRGYHQNSPSPGFNNFGNNSGRNNRRPSPYYKNSGNSFRGNPKNFHRGNNQRNVDISSYVDLKSFLEDPWSNLMRKMTTNANSMNSANDSLCDSDFNSSAVNTLRLDDSVKVDSSSGDLGSEERMDDSQPSSQESVEVSCESSLDVKMSKDSRD